MSTTELFPKDKGSASTRSRIYTLKTSNATRVEFRPRVVF